MHFERESAPPRHRLPRNLVHEPAHEDEYVYKYSGGFATCPQQHVPIAIYSKEANKTFFVYGGTVQGKSAFCFCTRYNRNNERALFWMTSSDGRTWSDPNELAFIEKGNYLLSWSDGKRVGAVMDYHPLPVGLNARTNVYYVETRDGGKTWTNVKGEKLELPLRERHNAALVRDYKADDLLVYKKDLQFDRGGRPVILYLTSKSWNPGPKGGPHKWYTAQWTGSDWRIRYFTGSDHNYDFGSLYIEADGTWRVIAPTDAGPEPFGTGGEIVMWTSRNEGASWRRVKNLTKKSPLMHTYVRRPLHAHPEFYAIWADGSTRRPSESRLYFTDRMGNKVCQLPTEMSETAHPCPTTGR
jgi:hypothetical protein